MTLGGRRREWQLVSRESQLVSGQWLLVVKNGDRHRPSFERFSTHCSLAGASPRFFSLFPAVFPKLAIGHVGRDEVRKPTVNRQAHFRPFQSFFAIFCKAAKPRQAGLAAILENARNLQPAATV